MFLVHLTKQGSDLHLFSGALLIKEWLVILRAINFRTFLYRLTFLNIYSLVFHQTRLQRVSLQCSAGQTKFSLINIVLSLKVQRGGGGLKKKKNLRGQRHRFSQAKQAAVMSVSVEVHEVQSHSSYNTHGLSEGRITSLSNQQNFILNESD